jgi:hypothetical protein
MAYRVDAAWDEAARVWIATSDDVPGLCAEAPSLDALIEVVLELAPDLLAANGIAEGAALDDVPIRVAAEKVAVARRAA